MHDDGDEFGDVYDNMRDLLAYEVYRSTTSGSGYANIGSTDASTTSYIDNTVTNGVTYYYVVKAVFDEGESPYSNEASAMPEEFESPIPEELTGVAGDAQATLSWTATPDGGGGGEWRCVNYTKINKAKNKKK